MRKGKKGMESAEIERGVGSRRRKTAGEGKNEGNKG